MSGMKFQNRAGCRPILSSDVDDGSIRGRDFLSQRRRIQMNRIANARGRVRSRAGRANVDVAVDARRQVLSCRAARRPNEAERASAAVLRDERVRETRRYQCVIITDTGGTITGVFAPMKALRRTFYDLRTEGQGRVREACAIGVGLFIGCSPFYGFHLLLCWIVGRLLGLNRLKVYLAANVSNPIVAPLLRVRRTPDRRVAPHRDRSSR